MFVNPNYVRVYVILCAYLHEVGVTVLTVWFDLTHTRVCN